MPYLKNYLHFIFFSSKFNTIHASLKLDQSLCFRLGCPEISADDNKLMNDMSYWLEGVIQTGKIYVSKKISAQELYSIHRVSNCYISMTIVTIPTFIFAVVAFGGILGNVASCYILSRREMRNSFNLLLVMLSAYDTFYLLFAILDSCRKFFEVHKKKLHISFFSMQATPHAQKICNKICNNDDIVIF